MRNAALVQNTLMSDAHEGGRLSAGVDRYQGAGLQPPHDRGVDVHRSAIVLEKCPDVSEVLAREVGYGVQHVSAAVEHEGPRRRSGDPIATHP